VTIRDALQTKSLSLGELFSNGRKYVVPPFQRNYSWTQTEWQDLWSDVLRAVSSGDDHYLGAVVLRRAGGESDLYEVIDGQQRLSTLTVVALALIRRLEDWAAEGVDAEDNRERAALYRERLIAPRDPRSLAHASRLTLNRDDDDFFQSAIVNGVPPVNERRLKGSERLLWLSWHYYRERVSEHFASVRDGKALAEFMETLARRLVFIEIVVDDEAAAYAVFETLNARGVALGTADLFKNFLFSRAAAGGQHDLAELKRQWDSLTELVSLDQLADLLHHHANTQALNVSKRDVFRRIRDAIASPPDAFTFVRELTRVADWYAALLDPDDDRWIGLDGARKWARVLDLLGASQYRPAALVMAPRLEARPADLERLFRIFTVYTLRASVVLRLNTGDIYRAWNRAAVAANATSSFGATDVAREARNIYGDDTEFESAFAELSLPAAGHRKKLLRYLLAELEKDASHRDLDWETDGFSIEHILPATHSDDMELSLEDHERWVSRIGNYVPLERSINRDADRAPFQRKLALYARSAYELPKQIAGESWTPESIRQRSRAYAARAVHIWRIDS
jgi:hypothetical protein